MNKNKKIKKELIVGIIGIIALVLIYFMINFFKGIDLFKSGEKYYVKFDNISQLVSSSPVYLNGFKAGNVRSINYDYSNMNSITVELSIDNRLQIPVGSVAKISTHMLGGADISIVLSDNSTFYQPGDTMRGILDKGIAGEANDKIIPAFNKMLPKLDSILIATNRLISSTALTASIENVETLTKELQTTTTQINRLLTNDVPEITERMVEIEDDVLAMSSQLSDVNYKQLFMALDSTINNIHQISVALNSGEGTMGMMLKDSTLYNNLNRTCIEATTLLENLRENPKRYVHFSIFGKKSE